VVIADLTAVLAWWDRRTENDCKSCEATVSMSVQAPMYFANSSAMAFSPSADVFTASIAAMISAAFSTSVMPALTINGSLKNKHSTTQM